MSVLNFYPLFVNHIADTVQPPDLRALFARYGNVIDVVIVSEYGFVNMADEEGAREAIKNLNGRGLFSNLLHVDYSEELKYLMTSNRSRYMCTPDPMTGVSGIEHPPYPNGPGIDSPFPKPVAEFSTLLNDRELLDERLRKVNEELDQMKQKDNDRDCGRNERRSRSRDRGRNRRSRSRERNWGDRRPPERSRGEGSRMNNDRTRRRSPDLRDRLSSDKRRGRGDWERSSRDFRKSSNVDDLRSRRDDYRGDRRRSSSPQRRKENQATSSVPVRERLGDHLTERRVQEVPVVDAAPNWRPITEQIVHNPPNHPDLRTTLDRRAARASDEFEDGMDIDLSKKNMKIQINIGSKGVEAAERQILLDEGEQRPKIEDEFDFFVGGLHKKVPGDFLRILFSQYGKVTMANLVKTFGFVTLIATEERALAAVNQLSETSHYGNKLFIEFRKGSKYEYLKNRVNVNSSHNDRVPRHQNNMLTPCEDGIVIVDDGKKGVRSEDQKSGLPTPVATITSYEENMNLPKPVSTIPGFNENLIDRFVRTSRQDTESSGMNKSWIGKQVKAEQVFDGYGATDQSSIDVSNITKSEPAASYDGYYSELDNKRVNEPTSADLERIMQTIQSAGGVTNQLKDDLTLPPPGFVDEGPKAQRKLHISGLNSRIDDFDLKDLFGQYGQINRIDSKITYGFILIFSSELSAVRCVCELDGHFIKGSRMRVAFMRGSFEDSKEFKEKWAKEIEKFGSEQHRNELKNVTKPPPKMKLSQIGEGLKNIDMSLKVEAVHPSFQQNPPSNESNLNNPPQSYSNYRGQPSIHGSSSNVLPQGQTPFPSPAYDPFNTNQQTLGSSTSNMLQGSGFGLNLPPPIQANPGSNAFGLSKRPIDDQSYLNDIEGTIHSIQNKVILFEFTSPVTRTKSLAKLIPGQMYINGQQSLGFLIKSNTFHTWPKMVKDFLQIGRKVFMDLKRLSEKEMHEGKDRERSIFWSSPLVWLEGQKPSEKDITVSFASMESKIDTARVVKLYPSWGLLDHPIEGEILFTVEQMFFNTDRMKTTDSLISGTDLEIGDRVAVHFSEISQSKLQDLRSKTPANSSVPEVSLSALLVWQVSAEVDPWVYNLPPTKESVSFLTTSSTLNRQLPGDREADYHNLTGEVEEVHLPAGGIIKLSSESVAQLGLPKTANSTLQRVYFHRSRLHINALKIQSDQQLDQTLFPGDKVSLDLVRNYPSPEDPPLVLSGAHWVALAVRAHTVVRGVQIAAGLRHKNAGGDPLPENTAQCRVVFLKYPGESSGPVTSAVAIVDTGEFLGQRLEFDRDVCVAFGFSLARSDLSHIMLQGEVVHVKLKAYNSYCVEKMWIGFLKGNNKEGSLDSGQRQIMREWLDQRGISPQGFDQLIKGQYSPRQFIPLPRQQETGQVVSLQEDQTGLAGGLTIHGSCGAVITADRNVLYVFGQWMGRADLAYCILNEHVMYEVGPRYGGQETDTACLVWIGGPDSRPSYKGQATAPSITDSMNSHLKLWLANKNMDLSIFKALIDGLLPSKKKASASGGQSTSDQTHGLDPETLAHAAMLTKLKSQYGSEKMMSALMSMMSKEPPAPPPAPSTAQTSPGGTGRGYYSSGAVTATYSSSPQPAESQPVPQNYPMYSTPGYPPYSQPYSVPQSVAPPYAYQHMYTYNSQQAPPPTSNATSGEIKTMNPMFHKN